MPHATDLLAHDGQRADHRDAHEDQDETVFRVGLARLPRRCPPPEWEGKGKYRFIMITRSILGAGRSPTMGEMARFATEGSGGWLVRNPYPTFADTARDGLELGVHF